MKFTGAASATSALAFALVGTLAVPVQADEAAISPEVLADLNANFDKLGVATEAREGLLEAYANGQAWDNSSGAEPINTESYRIGVVDFTREVFTDGSVSLTSMEMPLEPTTGGAITPFGISGCSYSLSAGVATWSNCRIEKNNGVLTMWYTAGYWRGPGVYGTSISNTWNWDIQAAGGACQKDFLGNPTGQKSRLRAYCTVVTGIGSSYPYVDLDVTSSTATVNTNW